MSSRIKVPQIDIDRVVACLRDSVKGAHNEEELKMVVSECIRKGILEPLGIKEVGRHEYTLVSGGRIDALYGHVIIEYKAPGKLSSKGDVAEAEKQVVGYIKKMAPQREWDRYLGVIISDRIAFVRYDKLRGQWIRRGPYEITREVVVKLAEAFRGLRRKPLDVNLLLDQFGPQSQLAGRCVRAFYRRLLSPRSPRTGMLFNDWLRLFGQATGYSPEKLKGLSKLAEDYGIGGADVNYDALVFAIQTYYALILKLLAAEVVYLYGGGKLYRSYIAELDDEYMRSGPDGLKRVLEALESGGIFKQFGISNFLEGDYFSWYLDEIDSSLADVIAEIARRLSDFEPATPQLEPEFARDLLKRLYQHLVPKDVRHNLGEYYTPDWLADLLLDEVGLSEENLERMSLEDTVKPLKIRVLDPACGSGTFLVRYIARLRDYAREHFLEDLLQDHLLSNVVGFDLNPLAVLTARTNYLLMIADLPRRGSIEIPIYLTDSLMVEKQSALMVNVYKLSTVAGDFQIPANVVEGGLLPRILDDAVDLLGARAPVEAFRNSGKKYGLPDEELKILEDFYRKLLRLEEEGKNRVWIAIIRNAFAPILKGRFDYVVGNPPWVNWENLPENFREMSKPLWQKYGIAKVISTGGFKKDLAMLFLARCFDLYLKEGGKLGFLMPFTVFKTQAGAGFREFLARKTRVHVVHDMTPLHPFEGATNLTGAVIVEKLCEVDLNKINDDAKKEACVKALNKAFEDNVRGIRHIVWVKPSGKPAPTDKPLEEVRKETIRHEALMIPLKPRRPESRWMQVTPGVVEAVRKLLAGQQYYEAHAGVYVSLNQVYFIEIRGRRPDGKLVITNPPESGQKKRVKQVEAVIVEPDLVYPLIRGKDVKKWYAEIGDKYVLLPHDPNTGKPYKPEDMNVLFPQAFSYLIQFKEELKRRTIKPFLSLRNKIKKTGLKAKRRKAEEELDRYFYISRQYR